MFVVSSHGIAYKPSGMLLSANFSASPNNASYQQITGFSADTANYPGSSVSSNGLVMQSGGSTTLTASASWSSSLAGQGQIQIQKNGSIAVTGSAATSGTTGTATATVNLTCAVGDVITLWWYYSTFTNSTVTTTSTFLHATQGP